jgi:hypothetical protein
LDEDQKTILATYWVDECGSSASRILRRRWLKFKALSSHVAGSKDDVEATRIHDVL